jgi:choline dehydrogenase-like flavoprotein
VPNERGEIIGASISSLDGVEKTASARIYVVACGGIETPRLLLLSRSERFPNGIGNNHDRVGRGFNEHASVNLYGSIRHRKGTFLPKHKIARSHQFYDAYRREGLGSLLLNVIQSWVFPNHLLRFSLADIPRGVAALAGRVVQPTLYLGTTIEMKISDENRVTLSESAKDPLGNPLAHLIFNYTDEDRRLLDRSRELCLDIYHRLGATRIREAEVNFSRHHQGTCRMGEDPRTSVTDRNLLVHETSNLYLCGAEAFVTGSAVPPTLTIVALAHRLADHLVNRFRQGSGVP